ncbi:MAG: 30S ribosomal protein S15 [Lewinellaceae bacterium]|nr:30S ribosomal protein S15 [Lewinellaceae bacterium]
MNIFIVCSFGNSSFIIHHSSLKKWQSITTRKKIAEIVQQYAGDEKNTGNTEAQIALLTYRIESLSAHLRINKKDHSTRRSLLTKVGQRKSLLSYYAKKDIYKYRALIEKLGLRK